MIFHVIPAIAAGSIIRRESINGGDSGDGECAKTKRPRIRVSRSPSRTANARGGGRASEGTVPIDDKSRKQYEGVKHFGFIIIGDCPL